MSNQLTESVHTDVAVTQFVYTSNPWVTYDAGDIISLQRRGEISYDFVVAEGEEGIFQVELQAGIEGENLHAQENLKIEFSLNGKVYTTGFLKSGLGESLKNYTPWLKAGSYRLTIEYTNYKESRRLRIEGIKVKKMGGPDADQNGTADWLTDKITSENYVVTFPEQSSGMSQVYEQETWNRF